MASNVTDARHASGNSKPEAPRTQDNVNHLSFDQSEQEIKFLKLKLAEYEEDKAEKMRVFNEERNNLESQVARLRAQVERGEATRQNLEYELTLAKKATNQVKRIAAEKEVESHSNVALLKEQISELKTKLSGIEQDLSGTKSQRNAEREEFDRKCQEKELRYTELISKLESSQNECNRLHKIVQELQNSMVELQEKCTSLEAQRQSQNNTLRHQAKDLEFGVEREERLKKELELLLEQLAIAFQQARERLKILEEHVEAERASHLETKFNSEIVQLRVRDLEGDLDVKSTALNEAIDTVETLTKQSREFEEGYKKELGKCQEISSKLKQLQEKYSNERRRTKQDQEEKQAVIKKLSEQLGVHQENFDALKRELNQAKKHQSEFDENYNGCLRDLQKLITTFGKSKSPKSKTGRNKDRLVSLPSSVLIDELREILVELQTTSTNAVNEAKKLKIMCENLSRENEGYKELMWSRDQAVEDVKQAAQGLKKELSETQLQLASKETVCVGLQVEIKELKEHLDEQRRNHEKNNQELVQIKNRHLNDDQTRLSFLHTIYQCLVAGTLYKTPPSDSYEDFSWDDMIRLLSDQIGSHISELNRAKEKVAHLEEILSGKEHHIKQTQDNHEATVKKLSQTLKEREQMWKSQSKEMEEHYGKLITDLHLRVQKTQEMADDYWQKLQETSATSGELEIQNKTLKNSRKKYINEKSALLASCALLAGTLWPAVAQIEILKSQKRTLTAMNSCLNVLQNHARFLCATLSSELSGQPNAASSGMRHGGSRTALLLKFRVGVVAVLALNRLLNFSLRRKTCIVLSQGCLEGQEGPLVVHCERPTSQIIEFRGIVAERDHDSKRRVVSPAWFCDEKLLSHAVSSMNDLCEKLSRRDDRDPSRSWSPDSCVTIARIARHCYQKLLGKLRDEFDGQSQGIITRSHLARDDLMFVLGKGLHRCLRKLSDREPPCYVGTQELVNNLQNFVLGLTQRLHKVEVERRDLTVEVTSVRKENDELKRLMKKGQTESQQVCRDMEDMREKLTTTVPRSQFENLYSELSGALEREKQAQVILNEQAAQLKDMERRVDLVSKNNEESDATLAEAIKNLSQAKMELRRKEQNVRQVTKDAQLVEGEKRLLQEKLNDAERAMTGAARERETVLVYLKGIQKGLERNRASLASLKQSSSRRVSHELSDFLAAEGKLTSGDHPLGSTVLACQNVVSGFLEVHQHTLVLLTQLEAEKQQAQVRIDTLESEINSHRSHINSLKDELTAVCQRAFIDEDIYTYDRPHLEKSAAQSYNVRRDSPERPESESYPQEFVPLMRYDSLSPVKSPKKQEGRTVYSSGHRHAHGPRMDDRSSRNTKTSFR